MAPREQLIHIHPQAPAKPAVGAPCNGCGVCCLAEPCPLGMVLSGRRQGVCSALRWADADKRYVCGAISDPAGVLPRPWRWAAFMLRWLAPRWVAAGQGCDADLEPVQR